MRNFITSLKYLLSVYATGIVLLFIIRFLLLFSQWDQIKSLSEPFTLLLKAFVMGFRFDTVISCYILFFPLFFLLLLSIIGIENRITAKVFHVFICICYSVVLIGCIANIPYFNEFFKHINVSIFNWSDDKGFVFSMIKSDTTYMLYFLLAMVFVAAFCIVTSLIFKKVYKNYISQVYFRIPLKTRLIKSVLFLLLTSLCFLGVRGRIAKKSPIVVGTAYFCNHAFVNQLGLNPIFYFLRTVIDSNKEAQHTVRLMPDNEAIQNIRAFYNITDSFKMPIARKISTMGMQKRYNVVVIIMEGMSAEYMKRNGNPNPQTAFLDSLATQSIYFDNYYTAGVHTMNGIFSTLFSYPALFIQHPMKSAEILYYGGLPGELKKNGYQTAYFTTHDDQFDNVGGFLAMNDVEFILSQKDYPSEKVLSTLGVPDDYMFERSIKELNRMAANKEPFFAAMMTASNHPPMTIPHYFQPKSKELNNQILEYSSWALKKFFDMAEKESWFDSTIFVLTADHGAFIGEQSYELPLSRLHSPLIIYSKNIKPETKAEPASQVDIFPTIMGLLNISYINNTLGCDLFKEKRKYAVLNNDNIIACISDSLLFMYNTQTKNESLYLYKQKKTNNLVKQYPEEMKKMRSFLFSTMQAAQYCIDKRLVGLVQ